MVFVRASGYKFSEITVEKYEIWPQLSMKIKRFTLDGHTQNWDVESQKQEKKNAALS
jgi:hypothetical protein